MYLNKNVFLLILFLAKPQNGWFPSINPYDRTYAIPSRGYQPPAQRVAQNPAKVYPQFLQRNTQPRFQQNPFTGKFYLNLYLVLRL